MNTMPPKTASKPIKRTCPLCKKVFPNKAALVSHIEKSHADSIPEDWSASRYENYLRTQMTHGNCIECGKETSWNESTWKYNRMCDDPKCKQASAKRAKQNMKKTYGKEHLLDDPDMQRKMIYSKKNSGTYYWTTDEDRNYKIMYASTEEKKFLEMLDVFLNMDPVDIEGPSPNTYEYKYDGKVHAYIPDYYIRSINLEVEIKEPKDNQNMHPKIQAVDKVKEDLKDKMMMNHKDVNYIKINGGDYREFFALLMRFKEEDEVITLKDSFMGLHENYIEDLSSLGEVVEERGMLDTPRDVAGIISGVYNPKLSYKENEKQFRRLINRARNHNELDRIEKLLDDYERELKEMIRMNGGDMKKNYRLSDERPNDENIYEAKKMLESIEKLRHQLHMKRQAITETVIYMEDVDIDYSLPFAMESTEFKGYNRDRKTWYRPVFVVLSYTYTPIGKVIKRVTSQDYTHAGLSFDSNMTDIMSFNMVVDGQDHGGFAQHESFYSGGYTNDGAYYAIYMYLAPLDEYEAMEAFVNDLKERADAMRYSVKGLINQLLKLDKSYGDEMFCSEFVSNVLKAGNPTLLKQNANRYTPGDLANTHKMRLVEKGLIRDYDSHRFDRKVKEIMKKRGLVNVVVK